MQTTLHPDFAGTRDGARADAILRKCVHCGFCLATCPTYQLLGNELDSPRGRIYLMKQVLEGEVPGPSTQLHLDRCLTCRNCETTCPSGVDYADLLDIGRRAVDARVRRPPLQRVIRWLLKEGLPSPAFAPALRLGSALRPLLPGFLRRKIPARRASPAAAAKVPVWPTAVHPRRVLLLAGCVQPGLEPNINPATARVLDAAGVQVLVAPGAGCCGAIRTHLGDQPGGLADMRRNIDAWWPFVQGGTHGAPVEAIVMNASGCGVTVKEYGHALAADPAYAAKAQRISDLTRDLSELVEPLVPAIKARLPKAAARIAVHVPCTLQHGQRLPGQLERVLRELGFAVSVATQEHHLCCGSAGTYSVLQASLAIQLRDRKLKQLEQLDAPCIVSANIGCIQHLQSGTKLPVRHWIEVVDHALFQ
jgi:glycolate oxidase iron-sulfur subunit